MKIAIFISLLVVAHSTLETCDDWGAADGTDQKWYWEEVTENTETYCRLILCIKVTDSSGTYGVAEYNQPASNVDYGTITDEYGIDCTDTSGRDYGCAYDELVWPSDGCGCPYCPTCTPLSDYTCPATSAQPNTVLSMDASTCTIDYDSCCDDICGDGVTAKEGELNDADYCDYDSNVCSSCTGTYEECPAGSPQAKAYADENCYIEMDDCCKVVCDDDVTYLYGDLTDTDECVYNPSDVCPTDPKPSTTTIIVETISCSEETYYCCNGYTKNECYVWENDLSIDNYCTDQFIAYDELACTDDVYECPDDGTTHVWSISRNDCCYFMYHECCKLECEDGYYEGYLYDNDDGSQTCKYKEWIDDTNYRYITPPCATMGSSTTTETPGDCVDDGKPVCCLGYLKDSKCDCDVEWTYPDDLYCNTGTFTCPEGAPVDFLTYSSDTCCSVEEDACCIEECEDGSKVYGYYADDGDAGAICAFEGYRCGECPLDDAKTCADPYYMDDGTTTTKTITRGENCEFDYDECCVEEEGCSVYGYEDENGLIACKYECEEPASSEEPSDECIEICDDGTKITGTMTADGCKYEEECGDDVDCTVKPEGEGCPCEGKCDDVVTEGTYTEDGACLVDCSGVEMMGIMAAVLFVCGIFGWM